MVEKVQGEPAILTTFLRDATYTSYVNGIASIDQRLVRFYLRPGYEDPGDGNWKAPFDVPSGSRKGLLATFNGGFMIADAQGGFYLNGITTTRSSPGPRRSSTTRTARSRSASGAGTSR